MINYEQFVYEKRVLEFNKNEIYKNSNLFILEMRNIFPKREDFRFIYRGFNSEINEFGSIIKRRKNRLPVGTPLDLHKIADNAFYKYFKWYARSEGIFTTLFKSTTTLYGDSFIFLPIGKYTYLYNNDVHDLTPVLYSLRNESHIDNAKKFDKGNFLKNLEFFKTNFFKNIVNKQTEMKIDSLIKEYKKTNLNKVEDCEIMFNCNYYYLFPLTMKEEILNIIYI